MSDTTPAAAPAENAEAGGEEQQTFSQADVDKLVSKVRGEERRKASERFADYDDLKSQAAGAKTVEQKLEELTQKYAASEARALRSDIAAQFGISAEDRDLFLTGSDPDSLTAQAQRLAEREADRKKQGNVAPNEGGTKTTGTADPLRDIARQVFNRAD